MNVDIMPQNKKVLCVGDNSDQTRIQALNIANDRNLAFNGLLTNVNDFGVGLSFSSQMDLGPACLLQLVNSADEVIFLDTIGDDAITCVIKNQYNMIDTDMKISEDLMFFGCSHTKGVGHDSIDTVYTKKFADLLGSSFGTYGFRGKGNDRIEEEMSKYSLTGKSVIIQFTDIFRIRYYSEELGRVKDTAGYQFTKEEFLIFTESMLTHKFLIMVERIVSRLRDADSKFLFFMLTHYHHHYCEIIREMSKYKEFCFLPAVNQDLAKDNMHFGPKSHSYIANNLYSRWNLLYKNTT